jgi:hypothetical protein
MYTTEIFIAYKIDRYLRLDYTIKRSGNFVHITSKKTCFDVFIEDSVGL